MYKITTRSLIQSVVTRWSEQYGVGRHGPDKQQILEKLKMLDLETCAKESVNAIIGNSSWTTLRCDDCRSEVDTVIQLGQEPDYESATAEVCVKCLRKALKLYKGD